MVKKPLWLWKVSPGTPGSNAPRGWSWFDDRRPRCQTGCNLLLVGQAGSAQRSLPFPDSESINSLRFRDSTFVKSDGVSRFDVVWFSGSEFFMIHGMQQKEKCRFKLSSAEDQDLELNRALPSSRDCRNRPNLR